jgi:hypothetical protein
MLWADNTIGAGESHFETTDALRDGPCKCAFLVSEQFAFQQARGMAAQLTLTKGLERRELKS